MKYKKIFALLTVTAFAAMQLAGCGAAGSSGTGTAAGKDPVTGETYPSKIRLGTINGAPDLTLPQQEGYFDSLGVKVEFTGYDSGRDVNTAFTSRSLDLAVFGSSPISLGIANKLNYKVIYTQYIIGKSESLVVKKSSGIKDVKGLVGKKIATPFASTSHYSLLNALKLAGVDPAKVKLLDMSQQDILAAWTRGDIDGAYIWHPVLTQLLKDGTRITDSSTLAGQGVMTSTLSIVDKDFAKKYPTLVQRYIQVLNKSYNLIKTNPDKAETDLAKKLQISKQQAKLQIEENQWLAPADQLSSQYLGTPGNIGKLANALKSTADFHVSQKNLPSAPALSAFQDAVDPQYAQAVSKAK